MFGKLFITVLLLCINVFTIIEGLKNGLALTPPQGWMSWQRFRCLTDCEMYPNDCISEQLFKETADRLSEDGYLDAGYEYLIIDDCWLAKERDSEGRLQPDPDRFPSGIAVLADYVHSKGLKFGIYEDIGTKTCGGYPGIDDNLELDANTFAEWGVDYIKIDGCYEDLEGMEEKYALFGSYLNQTDRPIVYSCSFPAYKQLEANYSSAVENCNLWRNYGDIDDSWASVQDIAQWFADNQIFLSGYAGPGHWNDPDMLIIGNFGLSYDQSVAQMTIWSLLAAPLIMSVDLRDIKPEFRDILLNQDAISINQDPEGIPGLLAWNNDDIYIWTKPILPKVGDHYSYAVGIVSFRSDGIRYPVQFTPEELGLENEGGYVVQNVFVEDKLLNVTSTDPFLTFVDPSGAILLRFTAADVEETGYCQRKNN